MSFTELPRETLVKALADLEPLLPQVRLAVRPAATEVCEFWAASPTSFQAAFRTTSGSSTDFGLRYVELSRTEGETWSVVVNTKVVDNQGYWSRNGGAKRGLYDDPTFDPSRTPAPGKDVLRSLSRHEKAEQRRLGELRKLRLVTNAAWRKAEAMKLDEWTAPLFVKAHVEQYCGPGTKPLARAPRPRVLP